MRENSARAARPLASILPLEPIFDGSSLLLFCSHEVQALNVLTGTFPGRRAARLVLDPMGLDPAAVTNECELLEAMERAMDWRTCAVVLVARVPISEAAAAHIAAMAALGRTVVVAVGFPFAARRAAEARLASLPGPSRHSAGNLDGLTVVPGGSTIH